MTPRLLPALALLVTALLLAGCARPPELIGVDNPAKPALAVAGVVPNTVFIATTRRQSDQPGALYASGRARQLGLASVVVTIPPGHAAGEVERARTLPPDPARDFAVVDPRIYDSERAFVASVDAALAARAPGDREVLLFIHGYNNTLSDSVLRIAQFVNDTGFRGVPVLFSWASAGKATHYVYDLNSALAARPLLEQTSAVLIRTKARRFNLFAHSMGAFVAMETMLQSSLRGNFASSGRLANVMLAAPDIDIDLFRAQMGQIGNAGGNGKGQNGRSIVGNQFGEQACHQIDK